MRAHRLGFGVAKDRAGLPRQDKMRELMCQRESLTFWMAACAGLDQNAGPTAGSSNENRLAPYRDICPRNLGLFSQQREHVDGRRKSTGAEELLSEPPLRL